MAQQPTSGADHAGGTVRETLESIIVALILAFVFRAFVVEAFVIPTGSMAPTLYGAHGTIVCEACGTEFAYGLRDPSSGPHQGGVSPKHKAYCPNCMHKNTRLTIHDGAGRSQRGNPESGDRILVLKWPYDLGLDILGPSRWDVIVFKDPSNGEINYIKRMVGEPNEVLMILDGDVYAVSTDELSESARIELDRRRVAKYKRRTKQLRRRAEPASEQLLKELDGKLSIPRKTKVAQKSLWLPVYNHDFPPTKPGGCQPQWKSPADAVQREWDTSHQTLRFSDKVDGYHDYVQLIGCDAFTLCKAFCAYNIDHHQRRGQMAPREDDPDVADQRIRFVWTPEAKDATIVLRLAKRDRVFWARLATDGEVALYGTPELPGPNDKPLARAAIKPVAVGRGITVAFENVDYRVALIVDDDEILSTSSDPGHPAYYGPDIRALRLEFRPPPASSPCAYGLKGAFAMTHVVVERDIYYHHRDGTQGLNPKVHGPPGGWASPGYPFLLRDEEYFMLGDNTAASKDSRLWDYVCPQLDERHEGYQLGTVSRDQMVGKAFFVYWPSPQRVSWLKMPFGVVPDVGRMRFIR